MRIKNKLIKAIPVTMKRRFHESKWYKKYAIRNNKLVKYSDVEAILNEAPILKMDTELSVKPKVAIIQTQISFLEEGYVNPKSSWLRYERFCKNNGIPYGFIDITKSTWLKEAEEFDIFVCHTDSDPFYQEMYESKVYILENILHKTCFPNFHEVWQYEDKFRASYLYEAYCLPMIPTFVTNNRLEAIHLLDKIDYPFISKTTIGSGSTGVKKILNRKHAIKEIDLAFRFNGQKTQYPYQRQKDYFYIQKFIDDATFDLRIMLVGDMAFGYYRYPNKGDYRASGAGNVEKKAIPLDVLRLAVDIRNKLNSRLMGVDLLYSEKDEKYYIIETSLFNQVDTAEQLAIDGIPGYYDVSNIDEIKFKEGKFWVHEIVLKNVISEWAKQ